MRVAGTPDHICGELLTEDACCRMRGHADRCVSPKQRELAQALDEKDALRAALEEALSMFAYEAPGAAAMFDSEYVLIPVQQFYDWH